MQQHGINGEIYGECSERWEEEKGQEERLIKEESSNDTRSPFKVLV